ncbi:unnamed protein product [Cylicocyclus nassatus]|uniref:Glycosyltransferase family 92 protein n=1 Tax=Cylicocyclus nassatus TaxID=53992 RepID=A0AA36GJG3_CYLNA|nr:unnamed protein product [Cylicocyclus nassatus]
MAVCVPPLYWYTNWAKMIFALEMWKAQGVVHVIIYHHSSTKHVYKVLSHYQKEGFVTIVPWPSLPQTPFEDPNQSLYRLAHSLAHNDCVLRLNTEFGALIDVDEVIMPRNHTLMSFVIENFANSSVGALLFKHHTLALNPNYAGQNFSYDTLNFSGIWDATELEYEGPPKIPEKSAALLHHRYNIGIDWIGRNPQSVRLLPTTAELNALHKSLNHRKEAIFPNGADFHFETQMQLGFCLQR